MNELPEAVTLAKQLNETVQGKTIRRVVAAASPHKFAFFSGEPSEYPALLEGTALGKASQVGMFVQIGQSGQCLVLGEGINLRYYAPGANVPPKHQLLLELEDCSHLVCTVQMYGSMWLMDPASCDGPYYRVAMERPSPLTDAFDEKWFSSMLAEGKPTLSAKALLATEQRVPGLGNGCLQDILFAAHIHPKHKVGTLSSEKLDALFGKTKQVLTQMAAQGGRNTEKDLYANPGGYQTVLSAKTWKKPCPACGDTIQRQAYLGGNVYFCPTCQPLV